METVDVGRELQYLLEIAGGRESSEIDIDDRKFTYAARFHRLIPFLAEKIIAEKADYLNSKIRGKILDLYREGIAHQAVLRNTLIETAELLNNESIPFLVLKGFYLGEYIYPETEKRFFADIDLLIPENDFKRTEELMFERGFRLTKGLNTQFKVEDCARLGISRPLHHSKNKHIQIDLHSLISCNPGRRVFDSEDCWKNTPAWDFEGITLRTLAPELSLIYLCWHSLKHNVFRLIWFRDLYLYLKRYPELLDNTKFHDLMDKYRVRKLTGTALTIASGIFNDPELKQKVSDEFACSPLDQTGYFTPAKLLQANRDMSSFKRIARDLRLIEGIRFKLKYLFDVVFPPPHLIPDFAPAISNRMSTGYLIYRCRNLKDAFFNKERE